MQTEEEMKIVLFGATGAIGQRIAKEAVARGHIVTAIVRDPARLPQGLRKSVNIVEGDVTDPARTARSITGQDVVISSIGGDHTLGNYHIVVDAAKALIEAVKTAGV